MGNNNKPNDSKFCNGNKQFNSNIKCIKIKKNKNKLKVEETAGECINLPTAFIFDYTLSYILKYKFSKIIISKVYRKSSIMKKNFENRKIIKNQIL